MIGYYDYTVLLTYFSLISATTGIIASLSGTGHPYIGVFFLLFCGLCDAFDGKVARTKKNRTEREMKFGIQIDSLSDLVAFGVLPGAIGSALIRVNPALTESPLKCEKRFDFVMTILLFGIILIYALAALIRLAYFNVTEEERQQTEGGVRSTYVGLPVTSSALIFPTIMLLQFVTRDFDLTWLYFVMMFLTAYLFLAKFNIRKPGLRGILIMVAIGVAEAIALLVCSYFFKLKP